MITPIVHRTNDIIYVRDTLVQVVEKTERRVKLAIRIVSVLLVVLICYWLVPLILTDWDKVEPITAVIGLLMTLIGFLILAFVEFMPDKIKIINSSREKIINWVFKKKGFNRLELKERLGNLVNEDEQ